MDIFRRRDGSYGFDSFRREPEDGRGWYSIGHFADQRFVSDDDALAAARGALVWLDEMLS